MKKYLSLAFLAVFLSFFCFPQTANPQNAEKIGKLFEKLKWRSIGPASMGGRTVDIDVVEKQPWIIYAAIGPSGVWKSENNGISWKPVFYKENTVSVGDIAIAQSHPNIIWVGTLFLDEIGNIPFALQAKLLGVIATRTVTRLGSNKPVSVNVRLICATNMPIYNMVAQNKFRQDLLYRINTVEINLPPLRERHEDLPLLTDHFLRIYCKKYNKLLKKINTETLKKFERYHWPGNVRELQHALERAVIMSDYPVLQPSDFLFPAQNKEALIFEDYNLEQVEKATILKVISKHEGNISHAAKELGLSRTSLYRRLQKYGL